MTRRAAAFTQADENPSVNRDLADKDMNRIDHALGRPVWPLRETFRNYFATRPDSDQAKAFDASPHWEKHNAYGTMAFYHVTQAGREALAEYLKRQGKAARAYIVTFDGHSNVVAAKSHGAARYAQFLTISDCFADLTFQDFAKRSRVRLAP